jgi:hypothetical protein
MERRKSEDNIARYLLKQAFAGGVVGLIWGVLMLMTNAAGLGELIRESSMPAALTAFFLIESALIFMPLAFAFAVGRLASGDDF